MTVLQRTADALALGFGNGALLLTTHVLCWDDAAIVDGLAPSNPFYLTREQVAAVALTSSNLFAGLWALRHPQASAVPTALATITIGTMGGGALLVTYWLRRRWLRAAAQIAAAAEGDGHLRGLINGIRQGTTGDGRTGG